jgi:HEAT repeat protein
MRFILGLLLLAVARAAADSEPGDPGTPEHEKATKLVQQLGDARFAAREEAAKQLLEMRGPALPAVVAGTRSDDAEVRTRCAAILPQIRAADWRARAEAFLADPDGHKADPKLFAEYEKAVGKLDVGSRKLFAEMVRTDPELMALAVARADGIPELVRKRCETMLRRGEHGPVPVRANIGQLAALFFADQRGRPERAPFNDAIHPAYQIGNPGLAEGMAAADIGPALRRLVVHWAARRPEHDRESHQFFALAAAAGPIPEAVPVLAQLAKDSEEHVRRVRSPAVWALGRIGSPDAQAALKGLALDRTLVDVGVPKGICTLGDCALAALAEAKGQKPTDLGMVKGAKGPIALAPTAGAAVAKVPVYGFLDEEARQSAQKKLAGDAETATPKTGK